MPTPDRPSRLTTFMVAMAVLIVTPLAVIAADRFTDVPDSNEFHDNIAWLADTGITKGCNPPENTEFCPGDDITREQMAAFMQRFAQYLDVEDGPANLQSDAYLATLPTFVNIAAASTTEVATLDLPAGSYLLIASGTINNNADTPQGAGCRLSLGDQSVGVSDSNVDFDLPATGPGDQENWTMQLVADLPEPDTANVTCTTTNSWVGNVILPQISAVSVQSTSSSVLDLASEGASAEDTAG